eukprot:scaffold257_cov422-Prasinococcus_capsulatus_cf.AAC.7
MRSGRLGASRVRGPCAAGPAGAVSCRGLRVHYAESQGRTVVLIHAHRGPGGPPNEPIRWSCCYEQNGHRSPAPDSSKPAPLSSNLRGLPATGYGLHTAQRRL